jgi:adenylosuccinate lyase
VLLALTEACGSRETAYRIVQRRAMETWESGGEFLDRLTSDDEVAEMIDPAALRALFDPKHYLRHLDALFDRTLGAAWERGDE